MPIGTDMGGIPQIGVVPRINPVTQSSGTFTGITAYQTILTPPRWENFAQINSFASIENKSDRLVVTLSSITAGAAGALRLMLVDVPTPPYTAEMTFMVHALAGSTNSALCGIALSNGTAADAWYGGIHVANSHRCAVTSWTNTQTVSTDPIIGSTSESGLYFFRVVDDGTNRLNQISCNGKDYATILSRVRTSFLTPTKIGMAFYNGMANSAIAAYSVYHWALYPGIGRDLA